MKLKVGQKVFLRNFRKSYGMKPEDGLAPVVVCRVGRKYFNVEEPGTGIDLYPSMRFDLSTGLESPMGPFAPRYRVYESHAVYHAEEEVKKLRRDIRMDMCSDKKYHIETLRKVMAILNAEIHEGL